MSDETIASFCAITGGDEKDATAYLEMAGGDLDIAVGLFLDADGPSANKAPERVHDAGEEVRRPIAPKRGVLVGDDEYGGGSTAHWIDPSRLAQHRQPSHGISPFASFTDTIDLTTERGQRLAELFKTPSRIMFVGTFDGARKLAKSQLRFLLVSLHDNSDFQCQMLNRDLWNDGDVQDFVLDNLIYLQLAVGTDEAERYMRFYPFTGHPHIALVDPRTGKAVKVWNRKPDPMDLIGEIIEYTEANPLRPKPIEIDQDSDSEEGEPPVKPVVAEAEAPTEIPDEPAQDAPNVTTIQLRMPDGGKVRRRFLATQRVSDLFSFVVASLQISREKFDLLERNNSLSTQSDATVETAGLRNSTLTVMLL